MAILAVGGLALQLATASSAAVGSASGEASASESAPTGDVDLAVEQVLKLVPKDAHEGLLSMSGSEPGRLVVRWKAPVPESVQRLQDYEYNGYKVQITATKLNQKDAIDAADKILAMSARGELPQVSSITARSSGDGLSVRVPAEALKTAEPTLLAKTFEQAVGLPVTVSPGEAPQPTSRQDDSDPWLGGAMYQWPTYPTDYEFCSTGFAVLDGTAGRLLSARHCDTC